VLSGNSVKVRVSKNELFTRYYSFTNRNLNRQKEKIGITFVKHFIIAIRSDPAIPAAAP
jgi:hypothetical protein